MIKTNKTKLIMKKVVLEVKKEVKVDGRTKNTGRPVNKKSARQARLAKQAFYADVNDKFVSGVKFKLNGLSTYKYHAGKDGDLGCIVDGVTGFHQCNVSYIGRTKVQGYTFVMSKRVSIELDLKTLKFVD
tara:strand:- start:744 stop:1133 length:390 start_codon:yes stop_codon:yes gene_type:complete